LGNLKVTAISSLVPTAMFLLVPVVDTSQVIIRRTLAGKNPLSTPGKDHLHHRLLSWGLSQGHSAVILWIVTLVANLIAMRLQGTRQMAIATVAIAVVLLLALTVWWRSRAMEAAQQKARQLGLVAIEELGNDPTESSSDAADL
jgi:UDP-GlcNAc:undecaprenyl-phosphate/decaprenyl-phosphate GlcNAc-1-phosphate transferase